MKQSTILCAMSVSGSILRRRHSLPYPRHWARTPDGSPSKARPHPHRSRRRLCAVRHCAPSSSASSVGPPGRFGTYRSLPQSFCIHMNTGLTLCSLVFFYNIYIYIRTHIGTRGCICMYTVFARTNIALFLALLVLLAHSDDSVCIVLYPKPSIYMNTYINSTIYVYRVSPRWKSLPPPPTCSRDPTSRLSWCFFDSSPTRTIRYVFALAFFYLIHIYIYIYTDTHR